LGWISLRRIWKESCSKIQIHQPCNETCSGSGSDINRNDEDEDKDKDGGIVKYVAPEDMEASEENISALVKSFLAGEEYDTELIIEA
jgi:hypothetical protein